jgi:hypothetical protein
MALWPPTRDWTRPRVLVLAGGIALVAILAAGTVFLRAQSPGGIVASGPGSHEVQVAYDDAKASSAAKHIDDLQIREANCKSINGRRYSCQINFVQTLAPQGRLFFTVVTIEEDVRHRWLLLGGLCKTPVG